MRLCQRCGTPIRRGIPNYNRKKYCGNICAQAVRPHTRETAMASFWSRVNKTNTCWLWTGAKRWDGYGRFNLLQNGTRRQMTAHRLSWEWAHGDIPKDLHVLHHCDTPACVNPTHLYLGDHLANMRDCARKGRIYRGGGKPKDQLRYVRSGK